MIIKQRKTIIIILLLIILPAILLTSFEISLRSSAKSYALSRGRTIATNAVNQASYLMELQTWYDSLVTVERDELGRIQNILVDGFALNKLAGRIAETVEAFIVKESSEPLNIPISAILGVSSIGVMGPRFNVACRAVSSANTDIESYFDQAGINQTRHRIIATIQVWIRFIVAGQSVVYEYENKIVLCETLIVGTVPQTYLDSEQEYLNLLPLIPDSGE